MTIDHVLSKIFEDRVAAIDIMLMITILSFIQPMIFRNLIKYLKKFTKVSNSSISKHH